VTFFRSGFRKRWWRALGSPAPLDARIIEKELGMLFRKTIIQTVVCLRVTLPADWLYGAVNPSSIGALSDSTSGRARNLRMAI
jgi:hypothetical protein